MTNAERDANEAGMSIDQPGAAKSTKMREYGGRTGADSAL
jgi:hypothetical protein